MKLDSAVFYSSDILKVIPFYVEKLGFELEYQQERFVSFKFSNGRLGIKNQSEEREQPGYQTVFIQTEEIEKTFEILKEKGLEFRKELAEHPWGKEFSLLDPDGNKVLYIQRPQA